VVEAPPKRVEPPEVPLPNVGFAAGVLEPEPALLPALPNRDGVDPPDVLAAPKGFCLGVLLPP
jgi:hypothetical protein